MTLELKTNYVLINDLQYINKHKHLSIILNAKFTRHICHTTGPIIMHMVYWGEYWAVLNITVLTSIDFVQKAHILYICTVQN